MSRSVWSCERALPVTVACAGAKTRSRSRRPTNRLAGSLDGHGGFATLGVARAAGEEMAAHELWWKGQRRSSGGGDGDEAAVDEGGKGAETDALLSTCTRISTTHTAFINRHPPPLYLERSLHPSIVRRIHARTSYICRSRSVLRPAGAMFLVG